MFPSVVVLFSLRLIYVPLESNKSTILQVDYWIAKTIRLLFSFPHRAILNSNDVRKITTKYKMKVMEIQTMTATVIMTLIAKTHHQNHIKVRGMDHHQMPGLMRLTPQTNHLMLMWTQVNKYWMLYRATIQTPLVFCLHMRIYKKLSTRMKDILTWRRSNKIFYSPYRASN